MINIPILGYHVLNLSDTSYQQNDHVALEQDIALLLSLHFTFITATYLVNHLIDKNWEKLQGRYVVLTFDDGPDVDFYDYYEPVVGHQKSFYHIIKQYNIRGTSFVIAFPSARQELDQTCIAGRNEWRDCWWKQATDSGILDIGNHSRDHNHET